MRLGLALSVFDLETWAPRRLSEIAKEAEWAEEVGFDSVWMSDHFFMKRGESRTAGLEPLTALSHLAARTSTVTLGSLVLCNNFRNVGQLARELATLAEAADGRLIVGLGCGAQSEEHQAFRLPFENRVGRLEETLTVLPKLLSGETVSFEGRFGGLTDASITTSGHVPPFWVAAFKPRMIRITTTLADGWAGNWNGPNPAGFRQEVETVRSALVEAGRETVPFEFVANLLVVAHRGRTEDVVDHARRLLTAVGPVQEHAIVGTGSEVARCLQAYQDAGATHAILASGPRQFAHFQLSDRNELAAAVREFADNADAKGRVER